MGENDHKLFKMEFPDKWKYITKKLAYPYEPFNTINDWEKPVDKSKKNFSELKIDYPDDEEIERTKQVNELFNIESGKELTEIFLENDVLLLSCVFEKFIKVSVNEFGINPLYCVGLPGYTWECGLKHTGNKLPTLQDKDLILTLENNIRGGISSVMGDRYVKSDGNKKMLYMDATNLYGISMSQPLPYDKIQMWHGDPDLYMNQIKRNFKYS